MTQELFTPGPWRLYQEPFWGIKDGNLDRTILDNEPYAPWVPSNPCDWHLIAASPELYDMVKKLVEFCPDATLANKAYTILSSARGEY